MAGYQHRPHPTSIAGAAHTASSDGTERIIDAALDLFGRRGFSQTSLKSIAARAEVSTSLIIYHFGSKAGLRQACDRTVADLFRRAKEESVEQGTDFSFGYMMTALQRSTPLMRYFVHTLTAGGPEVDDLLDQLIEDSLSYTAEAERQGLIRTSVHPRNRAVLMFALSFGSLILHDQLKRLIGVSPVDDPPHQWDAYMVGLCEIFLYGVLKPESYPDLVAYVETFPDRVQESS